MATKKDLHEIRANVPLLESNEERKRNMKRRRRKKAYGGDDDDEDEDEWLEGFMPVPILGPN